MSDTVPTKMHPLALLGLICSLVICCPMASLSGVIAGWLSLRAIDARPDRWHGRKLAILSIIFGLGMVPIQFLLLNKVQSEYMDVVDDGVKTAISVVFQSSGDEGAPGIEDVFLRTSGRYPSTQEVNAFKDGVVDQLGAYRSASIMQMSESDEVMSGVQNIALFLSFEDGNATGGAVCKLIPNSKSFSMEVRLLRLEVSLPDGTLAMLPPTSETLDEDGSSDPDPKDEDDEGEGES